MVGLGTLINVGSVIAGSAAGLSFKKLLSKRISDTVMQGVGLAVVIIGIGGALSASFKVEANTIISNHILVMIISLALGALFGSVFRIESNLERLGVFCEQKFSKSSGESTFAQGFVLATLVFCVGSMSIVGAMQDGMGHGNDILMAKSVLDGITSMIFASTMGWGVLLSAVSVGVYQGILTFLSAFASPYFSDVAITQMSLVGSVLILAIGLNILKISKIKAGDLLPSIFIPAIYQCVVMLFF